jgi:hypothetical protein
MNRLKNDNLKKCFSLIREFIEDSPSLSSRKGIAVLALKQLQRITAGADVNGNNGATIEPDPTPGCHDIPRIDG